MIGRNSKIAVVGAGAVGGITAAFMKNERYNVELVCKYPELAEKVKKEGLHVFGARDDIRVTMPAVARIQELSGKKDVVFLATKATDMIGALKDLLPFLNDDSVVVSLQNGLCEDAIGEVIGRKRTIGCVVGWGATMHAPGELEMTSMGEFVVGNIDNRPDDRLVPIKEMLDSVVPTIISENIIGHLYSKLIINACITSLGAVCGLYLGRMLAIKKIRTIFIEIMKEAIDVSNAMGIKVEPYARKLDYYRFLRGQTLFHVLAAHVLIRLIGLKFRRLKSSSLQSLERGRATEIDFLSGYISSQGKKHGISTPVNDTIVRFTKEIERGERKITVKNFDDPFFDRFK